MVRTNVVRVSLANAGPTDPAVLRDRDFDSNIKALSIGGRGICCDQRFFGVNVANATIDSSTFINNRGGSGTP